MTIVNRQLRLYSVVLPPAQCQMCLAPAPLSARISWCRLRPAASRWIAAVISVATVARLRRPLGVTIVVAGVARRQRVEVGRRRVGAVPCIALVVAFGCSLLLAVDVTSEPAPPNAALYAVQYAALDRAALYAAQSSAVHNRLPSTTVCRLEVEAGTTYAQPRP